jgi:hypothetical protein
MASWDISKTTFKHLICTKHSKNVYLAIRTQTSFKIMTFFDYMYTNYFVCCKCKLWKKKENFIIGLAILFFLVEKTTYNLSYLFDAKLHWTSCLIVIDMMWHIQNAHGHIWSQNTRTRRNMGFVITLFTTKYCLQLALITFGTICYVWSYLRLCHN